MPLGKRKRSSWLARAIVKQGPRLLAMRRSARTNYRRQNTIRNPRTGGFVGMELKFMDASRSGLALTAPSDATGGEVDPATMNCLNGIAQGDGESERDGRRVIMKSIQIEGRIAFAASADQADIVTAPNIFIALVWDKQTNQAQLNSEDVFTNPGAATGLAANPMRDLQYSTRFEVLKTWRLSRPPSPAAGTDGTNTNSVKTPDVLFRFYKKLPNIPVTFNGTGATVASITDNSLHLIAYASQVTQASTINYNSRLRFVG